MRAFVYCRVSTQEQATDDHYSLANQKARCRDYIKHRSWQLVKVLKDVGSGKSAERANYQELLLAIREERVDVVVVYRLDRLSRNVVRVCNALDALNRSEVGFACVQEAFDTTTAMGRARCGRCHRNLVTHHTKLRTPGEFHVSYKHPSSRTGERCLGIHKTARRMEELVVQQVRHLAETPRLRESALAAAREELSVRDRPLAAEREDLQRRLAEGEGAFDKSVERLDRGLTAEEQFARLNGAHLQERAGLRKRLQELEQEAERAVDLELLVAEVETTLLTFASTWEALTVDERRELLRSLVEHLDVYPDHMELKLLFTPPVELSLELRRGRKPKTATEQPVGY